MLLQDFIFQLFIDSGGQNTYNFVTDSATMKTYISPKIETFLIEIEETIANGSALTKPMSYQDVETEWEIGQDVENSFTWE